MKEVINFLRFLIEMPLETIGDWPIGTLIGIVIFVSYAAVFVLMSLWVYKAIDSWWQPLKVGVGVVRGKNFISAHTQIILIYDANTKTSLPHIINCPDRWTVIVEVSGHKGSIDIPENYYNNIIENKQVSVEYVIGRLSGELYIKSIYR